MKRQLITTVIVGMTSGWGCCHADKDTASRVNDSSIKQSDFRLSHNPLSLSDFLALNTTDELVANGNAESAASKRHRNADAWLPSAASQSNADRGFEWREEEMDQYATFRSNGPVYFKGSAGYAMASPQDPDWADMSFSEIVNTFHSNRLVGVGAGYTLSNGQRLEIEYKVRQQEKDGQRYVMFGYTF